jgi:multicomponent Na+:H+ antiporter subunit G
MKQLITDVLTSFFIFAGAGFSFIAAVGIVRMPDLFTRMQAAAKTGTLGVGLTIVAVAIHFSDVGVTTRAVLVILFLFLTAPVAAHMIARAGYISGVKLWEGTVVDEMRDQYDAITHELGSSGAADGPFPPEKDQIPPANQD